MRIAFDIRRWKNDIFHWRSQDTDTLVPPASIITWEFYKFSMFKSIHKKLIGGWNILADVKPI